MKVKKWYIGLICFVASVVVLVILLASNYALNFIEPSYRGLVYLGRNLFFGVCLICYCLFYSIKRKDRDAKTIRIKSAIMKSSNSDSFVLNNKGRFCNAIESKSIIPYASDNAKIARRIYFKILSILPLSLTNRLLHKEKGRINHNLGEPQKPCPYIHVN